MKLIINISFCVLIINHLSYGSENPKSANRSLNLYQSQASTQKAKKIFQVRLEQCHNLIKTIEEASEISPELKQKISAFTITIGSQYDFNLLDESDYKHLMENIEQTIDHKNTESKNDETNNN